MLGAAVSVLAGPRSADAWMYGVPLPGSASMSASSAGEPPGQSAASGGRRIALLKPGPMLPPVPAILVTMNGKPGEPDEMSVLWSFVVNGDPPQVGVSAGDEHRAGPLLALHREFVLNVPVGAIARAFDLVDMSSSKVADKFALSGLTRGKATVVKAPTVEEAPIQVECRVSHVLRVPPERTVYLADVVATTVHEGVCDEDGRLRVGAVDFFGMTAGSGEFYTMGRKVGHIGETAGRADIRY
jgi:flavin reductase (DIM6/NTAB) family NADH-FMN oxidoreductase RutF